MVLSTAEGFRAIGRLRQQHGDPAGRPYFSLYRQRPLRAVEWNRVNRKAGGDWEGHRGKFFCETGLTNVWRTNPVRGGARIKRLGAAAHPSQKPVALMERIIRLSSEHGDLVWEPFGGLFTGALAAARLGRRCTSAEIRKATYEIGVKRLDHERCD